MGILLDSTDVHVYITVTLASAALAAAAAGDLLDGPLFLRITMRGMETGEGKLWVREMSAEELDEG